MAVEDSVAQDQIRAFIERIERLEEEKAALAEDIKSIYAEAKGNGFHTKTLRKVVNIRTQDANDRMEQEALLELYMSALGMVPAPPSYDEERDRLNSLASKIEADLRQPKAEAATDPVAALRADPAMAIVDPSTLKTNLQKVQSATEPQPTKAAGSDLAPRPQGQVADIQPETATQDPSVESANAGGENVAAPKDAQDKTENTEHVVDAGKSVEAPASAAPVRYAAPGVVVWENAPPEGVKRHDYSYAFGDLGQDSAVIEDDLVNAAAEPIVKIGQVPLPSRGRVICIDLLLPVEQGIRPTHCAERRLAARAFILARCAGSRRFGPQFLPSQQVLQTVADRYVHHRRLSCRPSSDGSKTIGKALTYGAQPLSSRDKTYD